MEEQKKDTMKISYGKTVDDLLDYVVKNDGQEITPEGLASCLKNNEVKKDHRQRYEVIKHVSKDISSLIEEGDYMVALSLIENNSALMDMSPFYAGLALNLSEKIYGNDKAHAITKKLGEKLVQYCKSKCDYLKE
ncbi:hypothetical protein KY334_03905 [Candidatus Woesearchaeota archaeon]|nr:hypothetical protein [Candidatus Woesearchaeota archaeon]